MPGTSRRARRGLTFSLRAFLAALTVGCLALGWCANRARRQRAAVETLVDWGVGVKYREPPEGQPSAWKASFEQFFFAESSCPVVALDFPESPVRRPVLLPSQRWMELPGYVRVQPREGVPRDPVDDDLRVVAELGGLESLHLGYTDITDDGMKHLRSLRRLTGLSLHCTDVGDATLAYIRRNEDLRVLMLDFTQISDRGIAPVANFKKLMLLGLGGTRITNAGLAHVRRLHALQVLWLNNTAIDDDGLKHLEHLSSLQALWLNGTKVTRQGVAKLRARLPQCVVVP